MSRKMNLPKRKAIAFLAVILFVVPQASVAIRESHRGGVDSTAQGILWRYPDDISARNLYYGPGGRSDVPPTSFTFLKEDLNGTNPKFVVRDDNGVKWKVKLGVEARPETVAARLIWAVGYYANEDYFVPEIKVKDMPRLKRGNNLVSADGVVHNVRLKRYVKGEKKVAEWKWRDNQFREQREFNGLRVMMALINNWDLKDDNNSIYEERKHHADASEPRYEVSDLGASFGTAGESWTHSLSKGNLNSYRHSKFIKKVTPEYVDFSAPGRPALIRVFMPKEFISRMEIRWIGQRVPRSDAKWIGGLLAQLSPQQIRDAFRAAGYSPEQVEGFSTVVEERIAELNRL